MLSCSVMEVSRDHLFIKLNLFVAAIGKLALHVGWEK